ncbi:GNAT family N-acetyltransferase [Aureitalea marina]|uniref:N-acetyltransferase domain-containing protein n=1 Tax=Aureitalea marina TaxID=930804 RepID=A0A2S7KN86_9FLAO|nr:GNAT family N-acetyltransferase [Aureitalea marina]PQB04050.1 hypothetical protein BST85_03390 [Aureitalea marina]
MFNGLRTERLSFETISTEDAIFLLELHNSKPWQQNIGDRGLRTEEDAANYIRDSYLPLYEQGLGPYKLVLESGETIGTCGMYQRDNLDHPDLGYALLPEYFKQGYALEATQVFIEQVRKEGQHQKLLAITLPSNLPSVSLLKRLGFQLDGPFQLPDDKDVLHLFSIEI